MTSEVNDYLSKIKKAKNFYSKWSFQMVENNIRIRF